MELNNNKGAPVFISHDEEEGKHFINIRDHDGNLIVKVDKTAWDGQMGFTSELRDTILRAVMSLFG